MTQQADSRRQDENDSWLRTYFTNRLGALDRDRTSYWTTWRELASNFAPRRGRFLYSTSDQYTRGQRKDRRIIDNTPLLAARVMASGMMAGISSPARPWFRLRLSSDAANQDAGVRFWLDEVQRRVLHVFAKSNLYNCLHTLYGELGTFGTAALWVDEDEEDVVRGYTLTVGEYWLASSRRLRVDTLYRSLWWSVRQIVDTFGRDAVSVGIRANYDAGQLDLEYEIVHAIEPNPNAAPPAMRVPTDSAAPWAGHVSSRMRWRSVWFERGQQGERSLLRVSGYDEFPAMAPRWEVAGSDTYGWGPGWTALGDAQQLQTQHRRKLEAIDKQVKPPMVGPPSLKNEPASLLPGGITYVADPSGQTFRPAIDVRIDLGALGQDIAEVQQRVKQAFYADLFLMMAESDRREITAREIDERHEEKMLMLGPVLERLHDELLDPLVTRVFNIMLRNGMFDDIPVPPALRLQHLQVEFISMLAQAQNRFIAAKQNTLFEAPDAFYRAQGEDAIHAAPVATKNLEQVRSDLLDGLANDYQRQRLGSALDAQMQLTRDGMARHVAEHSLAWQRGVAQDRINILTKEAALHHNDTNLVDALGHAAANAARAHSRVGDGPPGGQAEDAAAAQARSGVLGAAIQARLDRGDTAGANALFTQVQDQLDPEHAAPIQIQLTGEPVQLHIAENEAVTGSADDEPGDVLSDASPEPLKPGQQYAAGERSPSRRIGAGGRDLTPREETRWDFFDLHRAELEKLEPNNPAKAAHSTSLRKRKTTKSSIHKNKSPTGGGLLQRPAIGVV